MLKVQPHLSPRWKIPTLVIGCFMLLGGGYALLYFLIGLNLLPSQGIIFRPRYAGAQHVQSNISRDLGNIGDFTKWSKVEIVFTGPDSIGMSSAANPFTIEVDVTFSGPNGESFIVPAFYDGDGAGDLDGNVWKVRFSPNAIGQWSFTSNSAESLLAGYTGSFTVIKPERCLDPDPKLLPDFNCVGRLQYVGDYYLKFSEGPYWLKGGADEPEDFLAPEQTVGFATKQAAVDFLAEHSVNSMYIMLHNIDGDRRNVWPWVGKSQSEARKNNEYFDVAKLAEWEEIFSYIQERGIVLHLVLEDDSAWVDFNRELFYREMIARFGHHNGLYWNIAEEYQENHTPDEVKSFAQLIRDLDPYDQPITVHQAQDPLNWLPFVGDPNIDLTSLQTVIGPQNATTIEWRQRVRDGGRVIPVALDEIGQIAVDQRDLSRHIVWSVYLGGGNYELFTLLIPGETGDPNQRNSDTEPVRLGFRDFVDHFDDMTRARELVACYAFWEMQPMNELLTSGQGYVFAKSGENYIVYLPEGGSIELDLTAAAKTFNALWFNPRDGATRMIGSVIGGGRSSFTAPDRSDWVLLVEEKPVLQPPSHRPDPAITATPTGVPVNDELQQLYFPFVSMSGIVNRITC